MRLAELWGEWSVKQDRVKIVAAKRRERVVRFVPLLVTPARPTMKPSGFDSALGRHGAKVAPYDAPRSYASWL